jgi:ketol-acid reductoisomerase
VRVDATTSSIEVPESRVLFTAPRMPGDGVRRQYQPSADGQRFLFNEVIDGRTPRVLTVFLNWQTAVGR